MTAAVGKVQAISVSAEASERNGKYRAGGVLGEGHGDLRCPPSIRVATVTAAPYTASDKKVSNRWHYMLWAIAVNDHGGTTQSFPSHIMGRRRGG